MGLGVGRSCARTMAIHARLSNIAVRRPNRAVAEIVWGIGVSRWRRDGKETFCRSSSGR